MLDSQELGCVICGVSSPIHPRVVSPGPYTIIKYTQNFRDLQFQAFPTSEMQMQSKGLELDLINKTESKVLTGEKLYFPM